MVPPETRSDFTVKRFSSYFKTCLTAYLFERYLPHFSIYSGFLYSKVPAIINPYELMYIYSDIVKPEPFNNLMSPLLEIIRTEGNPGMISQYRANGNIQYKRLERFRTLTLIKILIASDLGQPIPFLRGPAVLTLHFRRNPLRRF